MRFIARSLLLLSLATTFMRAQLTYQPPPHFSHIVIIFQENRTPDDLFQAPTSTGACGTQNPFEPGVDIQNGGHNLASKKNGGPYNPCMTPVNNLMAGGPSHKHDQWTLQYDSGAIDGACLATWPNCPEYDSVAESVVKPYYDIATNYGWANYMFQTNEGPRFPAHQFILGGTSAPVFPGDPNNYYQDFVAENAGGNSGCPNTSGGPDWINPAGVELTDPLQTHCYDHNTLVTYQDSNNVVHDRGVSWKYYVQSAGTIWDS